MQHQTLRASVSRRQPILEPIDADKRRLQAEHHEAAESAAARPNEAATATQATEAVPKPRGELQSVFLGGNLNKTVTVYLANGIKLIARLRQFDQYCLLLENGNEQLLVFKHAVSTIILTTR